MLLTLPLFYRLSKRPALALMLENHVRPDRCAALQNITTVVFLIQRLSCTWVIYLGCSPVLNLGTLPRKTNCIWTVGRLCTPCWRLYLNGFGTKPRGKKRYQFTQQYNFATRLWIMKETGNAI